MSDTPEQPKPLPRRPPRPFHVHWAVDSAIAILLVLFPALLLGWNLIPIVIGGAVIGLIIAPWTLKQEVEALERRPPQDDVDL